MMTAFWPTLFRACLPWARARKIYLQMTIVARFCIIVSIGKMQRSLRVLGDILFCQVRNAAVYAAAYFQCTVGAARLNDFSRQSL